MDLNKYTEKAQEAVLAAQQIADEVIKPVFVRAAVGIRECDHFARSRRDACVARDGQSLVLLVDVAHARMFRGHACGRIG